MNNLAGATEKPFPSPQNLLRFPLLKKSRKSLAMRGGLDKMIARLKNHHFT